MKKLVSLFIFLFIAGRLFASHVAGGELRYEFNGTNYTVTFKLYSLCTGIPSGPSEPCTYTSTAYAGGTRYLPRISRDTVTEMYCPSASPNCTSGPVYWIISTYQDTITLPPASDWVLSVSETALSSAIVNLASAGSYALYVTAGLNNATTENRCALIANDPPFNITQYIKTTTPVNAADADGDSVVCQFIQPLAYATSTIPYGSTYSVSSPFGTGSSASFSGTYWSYLTPNGVGIYELAMKTLEYRHGTLVGYSSRQWECHVAGTSLPKAPYLYTYYSHPALVGRPDSVIVQFLDSTSTDSVFVDLYCYNGWSYTTLGTSSAGYGDAKIKWTTPAVDPAIYPFFYVYAHAYTHDCPMPANTWLAIPVHVAYANDSVWPGDANGDHTVNVYDPLAISIAYGATGATRAGASTTWAAQYCAAWGTTFASGIDYNNADCNGDGTVNSSDLGAITTNYSMTHPKGIWSNGAKITGLPDLYFDVSGVSFTKGGNIAVPIKLGNSTVPVSKVYGVAGSVIISGVIPPTDPSVSNPAGTWMGTATNTLSFDKAINSNKVDFAYAKTDHTNAAGQGTIGYINFKIPVSTATGTQVVLSFAGVKFIDSAGNNITSSFNILSDTGSVVVDVPYINNTITSASVTPNPSSAQASIKLVLVQDATLQVYITDIAGKNIWRFAADYKAGMQNIAIPSESFSPGLYLVHIESDGWKYPIIKWIKQ